MQYKHNSQMAHEMKGGSKSALRSQAHSYLFIDFNPRLHKQTTTGHRPEGDRRLALRPPNHNLAIQSRISHNKSRVFHTVKLTSLHVGWGWDSWLLPVWNASTRPGRGVFRSRHLFHTARSGICLLPIYRNTQNSGRKCSGQHGSWRTECHSA